MDFVTGAGKVEGFRSVALAPRFCARFRGMGFPLSG
jgi:hypothetical protein